MSVSIPFPSDPSQEVCLSVEQLTPVLEQMLVKKSMYQFDASVTVKRILEADLYGMATDGCFRFCEYLNSMDVGDIDPRARVMVIHENDVITVMDGSRAIGHVAATKGIESAIAKAKSAGVGIAAVGNSQSLGAASVYLRLAVQQGLIGVSMTSTGGANIAGPNTHAGAVGDSAIAYGVPVQGSHPFIFDSSCGAESWGKLQLLERYGLPIPAGIVFDENGDDVTELNGAKVMAPAGGDFGFGISMLCSILAGPLSMGRLPINKTRSSSAEDSQHFFIVFNIGSFNTPEKFQKSLKEGLDQIRGLPPLDPGQPVRLPGDRSQQCFETFTLNGIPFQRSIIDEIRANAEKLGVAVPW